MGEIAQNPLVAKLHLQPNPLAVLSATPAGFESASSSIFTKETFGNGATASTPRAMARGHKEAGESERTERDRKRRNSARGG